MNGYKEFIELKREMGTDIRLTVTANDSDVIGYTSSGKPIRITKATIAYEDFTAVDHCEAAVAYAFWLQIFALRVKARTKYGICHSRMNGHRRIAEIMMENRKNSEANKNAIYHNRRRKNKVQ